MDHFQIRSLKRISICFLIAFFVAGCMQTSNAHLVTDKEHDYVIASCEGMFKAPNRCHYVDEKYGFSVEYPGDWYLVQWSEDLYRLQKREGIAEISFIFADDNEKQNAKDVMDALLHEPSYVAAYPISSLQIVKEPQAVFFNGYEAVFSQVNVQFGPNTQDIDTDIWVLQGNSKTVIIIYRFETSEAEITEQNNILESLTFIDDK